MHRIHPTTSPAPTPTITMGEVQVARAAEWRAPTRIKNVDANLHGEALSFQRGSSSLRASSLAHRAVEQLDEGSAMSRCIRPRRTPRLGHGAAVTLARIRRSREYRRLSALTETPEGAVAFMREYFLAAPEEAAAEMQKFYEWFCRKQPRTLQEQEQAAALVSLVLRG